MHFGITNSEVRKIRVDGNLKYSPSVNIRYCQSTEYHFSVVVSKKQGIATERNRVKRIIREIMRCKKELYPTGLYFIYYNGVYKNFSRSRIENDLDDIMRKISKRTP